MVIKPLKEKKTNLIMDCCHVGSYLLNSDSEHSNNRWERAVKNEAGEVSQGYILRERRGSQKP